MSIDVTLQACERCGVPVYLLAKTAAGRICAPCWRLLGCQWPQDPAPPEVLHVHEQATRERMLKRGGTSRHLARSGKS